MYALVDSTGMNSTVQCSTVQYSTVTSGTRAAKHVQQPQQSTKAGEGL